MVFEPLDLALRRIMRVMRVSDMNNQRHNDNCYMMSKVIGVDIACVPCPTHIAPSMTTTMDIYPRPGRNDGLDLVVRGGTRTQI